MYNLVDMEGRCGFLDSNHVVKYEFYDVVRVLFYNTWYIDVVFSILLRLLFRWVLDCIIIFFDYLSVQNFYCSVCMFCCQSSIAPVSHA